MLSHKAPGASTVHWQMIKMPPPVPLPASCRQRKWVFVKGTNAFYKATWELRARLLETFLGGRAARGHPRSTAVRPISTRSPGVKITNQRLVIEPLGWETARASGDPIKSLASKVGVLGNSVTLRFNQVHCGEIGVLSRLEIVNDRAGCIKAAL